jgi:hypothetical protein
MDDPNKLRPGNENASAMMHLAASPELRLKGLEQDVLRKPANAGIAKCPPEKERQR